MAPAVRAALLCIAACAFFAGASALGKAALTIAPGPELHPLQVTAARFLFAFLTLSPLLVVRGRAVFRTEVPLLHLWRLLLGAGGIACIFAASVALPIADVVSLARASTLFAVLFALWFLRERVDGVRWLAAGIGFAGVLVMMRPGASSFEPMALVALAAAILTGAELVAIRALAGRDPALTVLAINNALGSLIAGTAACFVFVVPSWQQLMTMAAIGVVMIIGQALAVQALRVGEASALAPFYNSTLIWAALIGLALFGEVPAWHFYLGAALIAAGGLLVTWRGGRG
jgi:drug/metabolite transporter (DMT)-like permease